MQPDPTSPPPGEDAALRPALLEAIFREAALGIAVLDREGALVQCNPALRRMLGRPAERLQGRPLRQFAHPDDLPATQDLLAELLRGERAGFQVECRFLRPDGEVVSGRVSVSALRDDAGETSHALAIVEDVSERKQAERALLESEQRFRSVVEALGEGIVITDLEERILYTNPRNAEITGYTAEELVGRVASELLAPDERGRLRETMRRRARGEASRYELRQLRKDGTTVWVQISGNPLYDGAGNVVGTVGAVTDISERKALEQALRRMGTTDALTGLLNRRGFLELAEREWRLALRREQDLMTLYLDVDDFKQVNDSLGHAEGDRLLQDVAALVRGCVRGTDLVARMGGDEFVVLAVDASGESDGSVAERIHAAVRRYNEDGDRPYQVSLSVGVHRGPAAAAASLEEYMAEADRRMYEAKRARRP